MTRRNYLKKNLRLEEYSTGVDRVLRFLSVEQSEDAFLTAKAAELQPVDEALAALVGLEKEAAMGIREMSNRLTNEIASLRLLLKSYAKSGLAQQESVAALLAIMDRYDVFARMNVARKIADAKALVRDLSAADFKKHVVALDGVHQKLADITAAIEAVQQQQDAVARAKANPAVRLRLAELKDQAKLIVNAVGDYLKGMSLSDPGRYADSYNLFCVTIESANQPSELDYKPANGEGLVVSGQMDGNGELNNVG